ncbi:MAG TPA: alkaline phosphatase [Planctomycetota bacterium]|nr:alkaline phosphatase [Planctomycetota bacterium]
MKTAAARAALPLIFCLTIGTVASAAEEAAAYQKVKNVILMIGDGMGINHVIAGRYQKGRLALEDMRCMGVSLTHSIHNFVTDSSAGATALASGYLIVNGEVGIQTDGKPVKLIVEYAEEQGKWTGLVATSRITHATPASMVAHVKSRGSEDDIAVQIALSEVDVIFGGGWDKFIPVRTQKIRADLADEPVAAAFSSAPRQLFTSAAGTGKRPAQPVAAEAPLLADAKPYGTRTDSRNLIDEMTKRGYRFIRTAAELSMVSLGAPGKVIGLFHSGAMAKASEGRSPSLSAMSLGALRILSHAPRGFFLMIEGSQIDWGGHANDFDYVMGEAADFDNAVETVLRYLRENGLDKETLVVVTADHETGGLSLNVHPQLPLGVEAAWTTKSHTAMPVPVFACGPRAEQFCGITTHERIGRELIRCVVGANVEFTYPKDAGFPTSLPTGRSF